MLKQLLKLQKDSKGFTLIELMIVVAIIGILAAIAIPNFLAYQLKAKRGELPINLKAIKVAEVAYQAENDTFIALTASPAAGAQPTKTAWADAGGFATIGWQPTGPVYGIYSGAAVAAIASDITVSGTSDIDGDGTLPICTAIANIANPAIETEPTFTVNPTAY